MTPDMTPDPVIQLMFAQELLVRLYLSLMEEGKGWQDATPEDMDVIREAALAGGLSEHAMWDAGLTDTHDQIACETNICAQVKACEKCGIAVMERWDGEWISASLNESLREMGCSDEDGHSAS